MLLIIIPGVPALYQSMLNVPDIALSSSMACRVFRNLKITARYTDVSPKSIEFPSNTVGNTSGDILQGPTQTHIKSESFSLQEFGNK